MFKWKEDSLNQFTGITMPSNDDLAINSNRESLNQVTIPNIYYSCKFCPLKFNTKAQMNFHLKKRHSTIRPTNLFSIEETPVSSSSQDTLINKCPYCPKTCKLKIALVNHIKQKHMATMSRNIKMYRPRGRPRKNLHDQNGSGFLIQQSATTKSQNGAQAGNTQLKGKRGRGRPRKSDYVMNPDGTRTIILKKSHSQNIESVNEVEEFHRIGKDTSLK